MYRRTLDETAVAKALTLFYVAGTVAQHSVGVLAALNGQWVWSFFLFASAPYVWSLALAAPAYLGRIFIIEPRLKQQLKVARKIFTDHPGKKIVILGSYGKTTVKELLAAVLSEGKKVAATPANENVLSSHVRFAQRLQGDEDILILELGEGEPGDIARFAELIQPTHAVITGLAPAHLDKYKDLDAVAADLLAINQYVTPENLYISHQSQELATRLLAVAHQKFGTDRVLDWHIEDVSSSTHGTTFTLVTGRRSIRFQSSIIGEHLAAPLAFVAAFAMKLGLSEELATKGIAKTKPFAHRMQPYQLGGAWIVDDTYNGNLEGIRAGTQLLANLDAARKVYVTPGLVDQGTETERVHREIGALIAAAHPDKVVLMRNSVTDFIKAGLEQAAYDGELIVQDDPLNFYTNLESFVAAGDVILMQNDWTDNYH